jgi:hypothetical protein
MDTQEQRGTSSPARSPSCHVAADPPAASPGASMGGIHLTSLELALVAQFNLEMAEAYDEVAEDPQVSLDTRRRARAAAYHRRDRARLLQAEAQRLRAYPTSVGGHSTEKQPPYAGPERRERERRMRDRRASGSLRTPALAHADRRSVADRRQRERRDQTTRSG